MCEIPWERSPSETPLLTQSVGTVKKGDVGGGIFSRTAREIARCQLGLNSVENEAIGSCVVAGACPVSDAFRRTRQCR